MKRMTSLLFTIFLVCIVSPFALGVEVEYTYQIPETGASLTYIIDNDTNVVIVGGTPGEDGVLEIPNELGGHPVIGIGERAFYGSKNLTSLTIPDSIVSLGKYAFQNCKNLLTVKYSSSFPVDDYTFMRCNNLSAIYVDGKLLPQLVSPSPYWGDSHQTCWKVNGATQGRYRYLLYRAGNDDPVQLMTATQDSQNCIHNYFAVNIEDLKNGTYYFTVESLGDGINYTTSKPSTSEELVYIKPSQILQSATNIKWDFPHITWTQSPDEDHILFYIADFYFSKAKGETPQHISSGFNATVGLRNENLQKYGEGYYYAAIFGISEDVLLYQNTPLSQLSPAYHFTTTSTKENLDNILADGSITDIRAAVQDINTTDLKNAILADQGQESGAADLLRQLEEKTGVTVSVEATEGFEALAQADIVGAALNDVPEGTSAVTLNIGAPEREHVIPEQYNNTVALRFSMGLDGVVNQDALKVPVKITLPIPSTINPAFLEILHYGQNGTPEVIERPYKFQEDGKWFVSIVLTHFSDFIMTETKQEDPTPVPPSLPSSSSSDDEPVYRVTLPTKIAGGKLSASASRLEAGSSVTLTAIPDKGYILHTLTVSDRKGQPLTLIERENGKYSFTMPASAVNVDVIFEKESTAPSSSKSPSDPASDPGASRFSDIASNDWFSPAVQYVCDKGIMNGTSQNVFSPHTTADRAMLVTVLYRLEGEPISSALSFRDVPSDSYYASAVAWASSHGLIKGFSDGAFHPNSPITREQLAVILFRYAALKGRDTTPATDLSSYMDTYQISPYAFPALQWANAAGIITGTDWNGLAPQTETSRAEIAQILMNFFK